MSTLVASHTVASPPWLPAAGRGAGGVPHSQLPRIRAREAATHPLCSAVLAYMQLLEDYSEPQPSMFYQTPQSEHIYQQKNKHLMEVYGFNDSFSSADAPQDLAPPPALPPKQRQLVSSPPDAPHGQARRVSGT